MLSLTAFLYVVSGFCMGGLFTTFVPMVGKKKVETPEKPEEEPENFSGLIKGDKIFLKERADDISVWIQAEFVGWTYPTETSGLRAEIKISEGTEGIKEEIRIARVDHLKMIPRPPKDEQLGYETYRG